MTRQKLIMATRSLITHLEKKEICFCWVCYKKFEYADRIHISNSKNSKYYHEDCYGRLLH